jgi:hypothetical protein
MDEFQKDSLLRVSDRLWQRLTSISLTPISKYGLGRIINFDFLAPSVGKDPDGLQQYYGEINFDFGQFGNDEAALMRDQPTIYCQRICHKIGYYLKHIHKLDLVRMKVEF